MKYGKSPSLFPGTEDVSVGGIPLDMFLAGGSHDRVMSKRPTISASERALLISELKGFAANGSTRRPVAKGCNTIEDLINALKEEDESVETILKFRLAKGFGVPKASELLHAEEVDPEVIAEIRGLYSFIDAFDLWHAKMMNYKCVFLSADKRDEDRPSWESVYYYNPWELIRELKENPGSELSKKILLGWGHEMMSPVRYLNGDIHQPTEPIEKVFDGVANSVTDVATGVSRGVVGVATGISSRVKGLFGRGK